MKLGRTFWTSLIFLGLSFSLTGCATLLSKKQYEVTMMNAGGPTYFSVHDHNNNVVKNGVTPQQVELKANAAPFKPAKYQDGYAGIDGVQRQELKAGIDWWTAGNIIIGGLPGILLDAKTGALWKLKPQVVGQVPAEKIVSNNRQGAAVLASYSGGGGTSGAGANTAPVNIQPATYRQENAQSPQQPPSF